MTYSVSIQADMEIELNEELDLENEEDCQKLEEAAREKLAEMNIRWYRILDLFES